MNADGQTLNCSFVFGGEDVDYAGKMLLDSNDDIILTGITKSSEFPTMNPVQDTKAEGYDIFFCKMTGDSISSAQLDPMFLIGILGIVAIVVVVAFIWYKR